MWRLVASFHPFTSIQKDLADTNEHRTTLKASWHTGHAPDFGEGMEDILEKQQSARRPTTEEAV